MFRSSYTKEKALEFVPFGDSEKPIFQIVPPLGSYVVESVDPETGEVKTSNKINSSNHPIRVCVGSENIQDYIQSFREDSALECVLSKIADGTYKYAPNVEEVPADILSSSAQQLKEAHELTAKANAALADIQAKQAESEKSSIANSLTPEDVAKLKALIK